MVQAIREKNDWHLPPVSQLQLNFRSGCSSFCSASSFPGHIYAKGQPNGVLDDECFVRCVLADVVSRIKLSKRY